MVMNRSRWEFLVLAVVALTSKGFPPGKNTKRADELRICSRRQWLDDQKYLRDALPQTPRSARQEIAELDAARGDTEYSEEEGLPDTSTLTPLELEKNPWTLAVSFVQLEVFCGVTPSVLVARWSQASGVSVQWDAGLELSSVRGHRS